MSFDNHLSMIAPESSVLASTELFYFLYFKALLFKLDSFCVFMATTVLYMRQLRLYKTQFGVCFKVCCTNLSPFLAFSLSTNNLLVLVSYSIEPSFSIVHFLFILLQNMARMLYWGSQGVERNISTAVKYYREAATSGNAVALYDYGIVLMKVCTNGISHILIHIHR